MRATRPNPVLTALAATLAVFLFDPSAPASAKEMRVTISNFTFEPQTTTIARGETVRFVNSDDMVHVVVATDGSFRSEALDTGDSFTASFTKPGSFTYFCGLHPFMKGTIVVK
jgi:plastocyanin